MSFKLIADTFSISRDSTSFIQLKTLKQPKTNDQIWLAIEIVDDSKYSRATVQSIIDTMEAVFFSDTGISAYDRFEQSLKEVNIIIKHLKEKRAKSFGKINAIIAVFSNNELHITQSNEAEAYLIRNNKFSMISDGLSSRSADLFVNIASGELMSDDKLIFSTARLLRLATHSQVVQFFSDGVAEAIEAIRDLTMVNEELSLGAVAIHSKLIRQHSDINENNKGHPIVLKVSSLLKSAFEFLKNKMPEKLIAGKSNANKKNILIALGVVIVLLALSVSVLMDSRRNHAVREEYRVQLEELNQELIVANTKGYANDKETANTILDKVDKEVRMILETDYFRAEAIALLDRIQDTRDSINNTDRLKEMTPYVDLAAKKPDVKALGIVSLDDNFFVYEYNRLYEVILDQVLDPRQIDDTEVVIASTGMEDQNALVFLTQSGRVIEFVDGLFRFANTEDQAWKSGVDLAAYGKYIYLLSPQNNQIYKYSRLRSKYSSASDYNNGADLSGAISLAIDGDIYVLKEGGNIIRLYKSKQQPFKIDDLAVDISKATQIYTAPELDNLYILDPVNKRVVIVTKSSSGNSRYYGQVVFEDLNKIQGFYVEKNETKLHVLTESEVYKIDI